MLAVEGGRVRRKNEGVEVVDAVLLAVLCEVRVHCQHVGVGLDREHGFRELCLLDSISKGMGSSHYERVVAWCFVEQRLQHTWQGSSRYRVPGQTDDSYSLMCSASLDCAPQTCIARCMA